MRGIGSETIRVLKTAGYSIDDIADATRPIEFSVREMDVEGAVPRDQENCVLARCFEHHGTRMIIYGTVAYRIDITGNRAIRYHLGTKARNAVKKWDKTRGASGFPLGRYTLLPPTYSKKLSTKVADYKENRWKHKSRGGHPRARKHATVGVRRWNHKIRP